MTVLSGCIKEEAKVLGYAVVVGVTPLGSGDCVDSFQCVVLHLLCFHSGKGSNGGSSSESQGVFGQVETPSGYLFGWLLRADHLIGILSVLEGSSSEL